MYWNTAWCTTISTQAVLESSDLFLLGKCDGSEKLIPCIVQTARSFDSSQRTPLGDPLSIVLSMPPVFISYNIIYHLFYLHTKHKGTLIMTSQVVKGKILNCQSLWCNSINTSHNSWPAINIPGSEYGKVYALYDNYIFSTLLSSALYGLYTRVLICYSTVD